MNEAEIVARLNGAKRNGTGHKAKCPAHEDSTPSLSVSTGTDGRILLKCHAGCTAESIVESIGLKLTDLFAEPAKTSGKRVTLEELASHKNLPAEYLRELGVRNLPSGGIGIPYRDSVGKEVAVKTRVNLTKSKFFWEPGTKPIPYGLDRLGDARELDYLVLVEGESDCWTMWRHELPALGIPGVDTTDRALQAEHVKGIKTIYFWREPDAGGDSFAVKVPARLKAIGFTGAVLELSIDGIKDPSDLHRAGSETFKAKFEKAMEAARPPAVTALELAPKLDAFDLIAVRDIPEIVTQDWLVEGLLPRFTEGAAGYVFGPAKARKSLLLADLALSVASGTPALGKYAVKHPGSVVGFFAEDPKGESSRRFHRMARARGIAVPANLHLINVPSIAIDSEQDQERLMNTLRAVPDLSLVWLDPMVRLHRINDNRAEELGPIHTFLRVLSRSCPSAVIVLAHHANKEGDSRGSTDYNAFGDFNIYCRKKDQLTTEITNIENRGGPPGVPFTFTVEDGHVDAGATMKLVAQDTEEGETSEAQDMALEQAIISFRHSHPRASGRDGQSHLKALGLKVGNDKFWSLWKGANP